jgi:hypothetical protein
MVVNETPLELFRANERVKEVAQHRDRKDQLEHVGKTHMRPNHQTMPKAVAKNTTVTKTAIRSPMRHPLSVPISSAA